MSKDTRIILIGMALLGIVLILVGSVFYHGVVGEVRVGDGHVASFLGQHNDLMMQGH